MGRPPGALGVRWRREFRGDPAQLHDIRRLLGVLLADDPARDDVILCVVELVSNALRHTNSKHGSFGVEIWLSSRCIRIAVADAGGPKSFTQRACDPGVLREGGHGLAIVEALSTLHGVQGDEQGRTVWAEFHKGATQAAAWSELSGHVVREAAVSDTTHPRRPDRGGQRGQENPEAAAYSRRLR